MKKSYLIFLIALLLSTFEEIQAQKLLSSIGNNERFGCSVASNGDVNGDGYNDLIVGDDAYNNYKGCVFIYFGSSSGINTNPNLTILGTSTKNTFGVSVAYLGDVNGDGFDDILVGATGDTNETDGYAYIYYGGKNMDITADVILSSPTSGLSKYNIFGEVISGIGDINHDGYTDVIVGASNVYNNLVGRAYIYYGGTNMDNIPDIILLNNKFDRFGSSVSLAGDVNKDGYNDIIIGSSFNAYIYYGNSTSISTTANVILKGDAERYWGWKIAAGAGDVNKDGYDDIIVSDPNYNTNTGRTSIYYGGNVMDSIADITIIGSVKNSYFGSAISPVGDINKDGYDDIIIGTPKSGIGVVNIYYGGDNMDTKADITLKSGKELDDYGFSISTEDMDKDGYNEIIIGAPASGVILGKVYIYDVSETTTSTISIQPYKEPKIKIYPNPARNELHISTINEDTHLLIYDISGKLILQSIQSTIDISSLRDGIYTLKIVDKKGVSTKKFVKQ